MGISESIPREIRRFSVAAEMGEVYTVSRPSSMQTMKDFGRFSLILYSRPARSAPCQKVRPVFVTVTASKSKMPTIVR